MKRIIVPVLIAISTLFCGLAKGVVTVEELSSFVKEIKEVGATTLDPWLWFPEGKTLEAEDMAPIINFCKENAIKGLDFKANDITADVAETLVQGLIEIEPKTNVKSLVFIDNQLGQDGIRRVAKRLKENHILDTLVIDEEASRAFEQVTIFYGTELKELCLGDRGYNALYADAFVINSIYSIDSFLASLMLGLLNNPRLTKIDLRYIPIKKGSENEKTLLKLAWEPINEVILIRCFKQEIDIEWSRSFLKTCSCLTTLDLSENPISSSHLDLLFNDEFCPITHLRLVGCKIVIDAECAEEIEERLKKNKTLESLDLSRNLISCHGTKALGAALCENGTLETLELGRNSIGCEGAKMLSKGLRYNSSLTQLDLKFNGIGNEGAKMLSEELKHNSSLTQLDLKFNGIGNEGTKMLMEGLEHTSNLTQLNLNFNGIGNEGAKAIADVLRLNKANLAWLDLGRNDMNIEGDKSILEALKTNTTLYYIELRILPEVYTEILPEIASRNRTLNSLKILKLTDNKLMPMPMPPKDFNDLIIKSLGNNTTLTDLNYSSNTFLQ